MTILQTYSRTDPLEELQPVMTKEQLLALKEEAKRVYVHPSWPDIWRILRRRPESRTGSPWA